MKLLYIEGKTQTYSRVDLNHRPSACGADILTGLNYRSIYLDTIKEPIN